MQRRLTFVIACVLASSAVAHADVASPQVRVALECELVGRTKACPAFLQGLVDEYPVLLGSPRAGADVVIYASATQVALVDRVHLRFVGHFTGAPAPVELDVDLDTRASDDEQRATLAPVFRRGVGWFVATRYPSAVD